MQEFFSKPQDSGIVLTSRIRLARNVENLPFPHMLSAEDSKKITDMVADAALGSKFAKENDFHLIELKDLKPIDRASLVERHLVSMDLINSYEKSSAILSRDEDIAIMINEEDHIRLQVIYQGFRVKEAYEFACKIDDAIEEKINYAFDSTLGYLTSCPTNVGTGIRASVMLHLPGLSITKNINNILNTVTQVGMTIRGLYGEGSNIMGNIYQISNQVTLGLSEDDIINNLIAVTKKIVDQEKLARGLMYEKQPEELEDDIYRSLGTLKYARLLTSTECLNLLSKVRMGVEMGIIKDIDSKKLNDLIVNIQPATLQILEKRELDSRERDMVRAGLVREMLKQEG